MKIRATTVAIALMLACAPAAGQDIIGSWRGQLVSSEGKTITMVPVFGCGDFSMTLIVDEPGQPGQPASGGHPPIAAVPPHKSRMSMSGELFLDKSQIQMFTEQWSPTLGPRGAIPKPLPMALDVISIYPDVMVVEDPACVKDPGKLTGPDACRFILNRTR